MVEVLDEGEDPTLEVERVGEALVLVVEHQGQPLVQVRHLPKAMDDGLAIEVSIRKDLRVGPEADDRAAAVALTDGLYRRQGRPALVLLEVFLAVAVDP